jgi:hypothetical protein
METTMTWKFDDAGFAADVDVLKDLARDIRRRELAFDRAAFWENMMQSLEDYDLADGDRPAGRRG